ncbi:HD-GYP domain-containing protein [Undibacterium sp. LX40W]|uniref:HD-GYP domain-containing protein n=1 Tax=Undibacterium nitidum TaxID=2762298 RepID=A0A923KQV8_9BURK|nr:HD-GYP domain-containing protein [Undibacterium nitidum]MBC3883383.1 HD-GYP domain-containing protein [Undibacterium nitidum]MBC3893665.1 HD-GYP domain-containing protein [Undibacterium sp. LX40W]
MPNSSQQLCESLRISIDELRLGMFVAELDRPWVQSPFLLQGFLLSEELDLHTLQGLVKEVVIDPSRSNYNALLDISFDRLHEAPESSDPAQRRTVGQHIQIHYDAEPNQLERVVAWLHRKFTRSEFATTRRLRHHRARKYAQQQKVKANLHVKREVSSSEEVELDQVTEATITHIKKSNSASLRKFVAAVHGNEQRTPELLEMSWWEKWLRWNESGSHWHGSLWNRSTSPRKKKHRPEYVPEEIHLFHYPVETTMSEELVRAREVVAKAGALITKLEHDLRNMQAIELKEVLPTVQLLSESVIANPSAMMWLLRMRSENTVVVSHALKVSVYMLTLGRHIGFNKEQMVELGFIGLLLDVGKLEMPPALLSKPERLSEQEAELIQTHVDASIQLLESKEPLSFNVRLGINEHHERMDGSGYPRGLSGGEISIFGRMAAIADSFAAMTSERTYSETLSSFDAMKELFKMAEGQLHAPLVEEFVQAVGIFPVGSLIQLTTGEIAIVLEHNKVRRLDPKVLLLTRSDKTLLEKPIMFDLLKQDLVDDAERISIMRGLPDGAYGLVCHDFYKAT